MTDVQLQPTEDEVLQVEPVPPLGTVPVCLVDAPAPVRTKQLPDEAGGTRTIQLGTAKRQIQGADPYRARVLMTSFDQDFRYAFSETSCEDPSAMSRQPKNVPLNITCTTQVWVMAVTGTTEFSFTIQKWATGE